jgi:hypothetical protein
MMVEWLFVMHDDQISTEANRWTTFGRSSRQTARLRSWFGAEAELGTLLLPIDGERPFKVRELKHRRLRAVQDGFDDVGG